MNLDSISLYIHIPFCRQKCDYCDFYSVAECNRRGKINDLSDDYIESVLNEIRCYVKNYSIKKWNTVYIGGGTPSLLSESQLYRLCKGILESVPLINDSIEFTVEMNPENVTEEYLYTAQKAGVTRLSLGIQSLNNKVLSGINRGCTSEVALNALKIVSKVWNGSFSVDFIAGLPGETYESFENGLKRVFEFKPDHISLYTLTVEENTPLFHKINNGIVKWNPDNADSMWLKGRNILEANEFVHYEVSNFCKKGYKSRHNEAYWKQMNYLGCGCGACGTIYNLDTRWTDTMSVPDYIRHFKNIDIDNAAVESFPRNIEIVDKDTQKFEFLMMGFRLLDGIFEEDYFDRFHERLPAKFYDVFELWIKKGFAVKSVTDSGINYKLNKKGSLFLNSFLEELI